MSEPTDYREKIDTMYHYDLCHMWRFAAVGEPLLQGKAGEYFRSRLFDYFGGFTPLISKSLG